MKSDQEAASTPEGLRIERARYAQVWSDVDAARFEADGHYAWMAERLDDHHLVCEVGVGDGRSTIELLRRGHVVVGVDENPSCLHLAQTRIAAQGFPVALIHRETVRAARDGYSITYAPIAATRPSQGALLIEGDTKNDPHLLDWLAQQRFDGVAAWLLGTHQSRSFNAALQRENLRTAQDYKLSTLAALYKWSDSILGPGGVLGVVDRGRG